MPGADADAHPGCVFCRANNLARDPIRYENDSLYVLSSIDPDIPAAMLIIPHRHVETPFELSAGEFSALAEMLPWAKAQLERYEPDGYSVGWNVGHVGGQDVFHAHLHVIARFADDTNAGRGIRKGLVQPKRIREQTQ